MAKEDGITAEVFRDGLAIDEECVATDCASKHENSGCCHNLDKLDVAKNRPNEHVL